MLLAGGCVGPPAGDDGRALETTTQILDLTPAAGTVTISTNGFVGFVTYRLDIPWRVPPGVPGTCFSWQVASVPQIVWVDTAGSRVSAMEAGYEVDAGGFSQPTTIVHQGPGQHLTLVFPIGVETMVEEIRVEVVGDAVPGEGQAVLVDEGELPIECFMRVDNWEGSKAEANGLLPAVPPVPANVGSMEDIALRVEPSVDSFLMVDAGSPRDFAGAVRCPNGHAVPIEADVGGYVRSTLFVPPGDSTVTFERLEYAQTHEWDLYAAVVPTNDRWPVPSDCPS